MNTTAMLLFGSTVSFLVVTAFALAFVVLVCNPILLSHFWRLAKCAAVLSLAVHTVTEVWPAIPDHPWTQNALGIGQAVAVQLHDSAWTALTYGSCLIVPLLLG